MTNTNDKNEIVNSLQEEISPYDKKEEETQQVEVIEHEDEKEDVNPFQKEISKEEQEYERDLKEFQKKYFLVMRGGDAEICYHSTKKGLCFMKISAFHTMKLHHHHFVPSEDNPKKKIKKFVTKGFMEHKLTGRYNDIIFDPAETTLSDNLNLWRGWSVKSKKGDVSMFLELTDALCNFDKKAVKFLLDFCAHSIQKPWEVPGKCVVFRGPQGCGKGQFVQLMGSFAKSNFVHVIDPKMLVGDFTDHLLSCYYLFADETVWGGDITVENILKGMITEKTSLTNIKHKTAVVTENYKRIFMASNNDWAAPVSEGDRRYFVVDVSDKYKGQTGPGEFFDRFLKWLDNGGREAVFEYLLTRDISDFSPHKEQPKTKAWVDLMVMGLDTKPVFKYLFEIINGDVKPNHGTAFEKENKICWYRSKIYSDFVEWCKELNVKFVPSRAKFGEGMNKVFGFESDDKNWKVNWKKQTDYYYKTPSEKESKRRFAENFMRADPELVFFDYLEVPKMEEPRKEVSQVAQKVVDTIIYDKPKTISQPQKTMSASAIQQHKSSPDAAKNLSKALAAVEEIDSPFEFSGTLKKMEKIITPFDPEWNDEV